MRLPRCLIVAASVSAIFMSAQSFALDMTPPDLQRADEYGVAAQAAARAFDRNPIEGVVFVRNGIFRVWSATCSAEVRIAYAFEEAAPLSAPNASTEVRDMRCGKQN